MKHYVKQLERENERLQKQVFQFVETLNQIDEWLEGEVESNDGTCYEVVQEDTFEMGVLAGRLECAQGILRQIEKWENQGNVPHPKEVLQGIDEWSQVELRGQIFDLHFFDEDGLGLNSSTPVTLSMYPVIVDAQGVAPDTERWVYFSCEGSEGT